MFLGEYSHNIDDKGRLIIPSKFRENLGSKFVITRGMEKCLFVYPIDEWQKLIQGLKQMPFTKKKNRDFQRFFLSGAHECEIDKQGRANITLTLTKYADLKKECVVVGVNERIEIWDKDLWSEFIEENIDNFSEIAEDLFDFE